MKLVTRKKFVRAFVSSVLSSELTENEVMEIVNEFPYDPELTQDIRRGLSTVLELIYSTGIHKNESIPLPFGESFDAAYSIIKKRRLSKREILELIGLAVGNKGLKVFSENDSVKEILETFYSTASMREQNIFIELLNHGVVKDDAFLKGMLRKHQN